MIEVAKGERLDKEGHKDFVKWEEKNDGTAHLYYGEKGSDSHGHVVFGKPGSGKAIIYERDKSGHEIRWGSGKSGDK